MNKCQLSSVLKALARLLLVPLLIVGLIACSSNSGRAPASTGQWYSCQAAETRSGWNCREGYSGDSVPTKPSATMSATDSSAESASASTVSHVSVSANDQESGQPKIHEPEPKQVQTDLKTVKPTTVELSDGQIDEDEKVANYSIQLAAFTTEERRNSYLEQIPIARLELILESGQRDGQIWWLVLYGQYQNYQQALEAQEYLVGTYGMTNTWIKPLN